MDKPKFLSEDDQTRTRQWRVQWDKILRDSVVVTLKVRQWYPYTSLDLGRLARLGVQIETAEARGVFEKLVHAGRIDLVPREAHQRINSAASAARGLLKNSTYDMAWGRVLPASAYPTWKAKHKELVGAFDAAVDYLLDNLRDGDMLLGQMRQQYEALYSEAYDRLRKVGKVSFTIDRDEFVNEAIADLNAAVPESDILRGKYSLTTEFGNAPMSDELAEAEARAQMIRKQALLSDEQLDEDRKRILSEMQGEVMAQTEQRRKDVEIGLAKAEDAFYANLSQILADLNQTMQGNGTLLGRGSLQLRNLIDRVRSLNVFEDAGLDAQMAALDTALEKRVNGPSKTRQEALDELRAGLTTANNYVADRLAAIPKARGIRVVADAETAPQADGEVEAGGRTIQRHQLETPATDDEAGSEPVQRQIRRTTQPVEA